jgi:hypothetical protein
MREALGPTPHWWHSSMSARPTHGPRERAIADLSAFGGLAAHAAYSCCRTDNVDEAATWLEWGRARVLSDALDRDRSDLAELERRHAELSERYRSASAHPEAREHAIRCPASATTDDPLTRNQGIYD